MTTDDEIMEDLVEKNDLLENYFRNTIIPQLFVDADLVLRKFTPPAMKQFQLSLSDLGKPVDNVKDNFRFAGIMENIQYVIDNNEILEKEVQTTDLRWFQMNILPYVVQKNKKTNGVIITFVEITPRITDLKEQEKIISDHEILLDTISHDIKTPLTNLLIGIELIKDVPPEKSEQFKPLLKILENAIRKMQQLIGELTETRKQKHKYKEQEELLNFENILEDVRRTLAENVVQTDAVIHTEINVSEINFSRRKLRSIIYNLVNNAIKFRSPQRTAEIWIKTERSKDEIVITVKDNGIGIEKCDYEKIFTKYYRNEEQIEGSGIGLFLAKEIVSNAGGRITVESEPGKGSEFKVYLLGNHPPAVQA